MNLLGRRRVDESEKYPRWYGKAYYDFSMSDPRIYKICYPIPINLIVGLLRRIYQAARMGLKPSIFDREISRRIREERDGIRKSAFELGQFYSAQAHEKELNILRKEIGRLQGG